MNEPDVKARVDALEMLKNAQHMIQEGRAELDAANEKITAAQRLINESAAVLRDTWDRRAG